MVIREYLHTKRRWLGIVIAAPIVAGLVTAGVVNYQPPKTAAQVTVFVPPVLGTSDGPVGLYVARVRQALLLDNVLSEVTTKALITPADLVSVAVERSGQSDQFVLSAVTRAAPERAIFIAETATKVGTEFVARQALSGLSASTEVAHKAFVQAQVDLSAYQDEIGELDPNATYIRLRSGQADTDPQQEKKLADEVRRYNELKGNLQTAGGVLNSAQAQSTKASAEIVAAESGTYIISSSIQVDPIPGMRYLKPAGLAAVLAFMVAVGLTLLPDLLNAIRGGTAAAAGVFSESGPLGAVTVVDQDGERRLVPPGSVPANSNDVPVQPSIGAAASDAAAPE
jgi:hypothetical protein